MLDQGVVRRRSQRCNRRMLGECNLEGSVVPKSMQRTRCPTRSCSMKDQQRRPCCSSCHCCSQEGHVPHSNRQTLQVRRRFRNGAGRQPRTVHPTKHCSTVGHCGKRHRSSTDRCSRALGEESSRACCSPSRSQGRRSSIRARWKHRRCPSLRHSTTG